MLKILRRLCDFGKCLSFKRRNDFATSVCTFWLMGGLNQIIFLLAGVVQHRVGIFGFFLS